MKKIATGNKAVAEAVKQVKPDVVAAYPITPHRSRNLLPVAN
jgi:pyruvate ferredoxin oxidoreductase alpha subunit